MLSLLGRLGFWGVGYWIGAVLFAFTAVTIWIRARRLRGSERRLALTSGTACLLASIMVTVVFFLAR